MEKFEKAKEDNDMMNIKDWDRAQHLTTSAAYDASEQVMKAINSTAIQLSVHPSVWQQQAQPITFGAGFIGGFLLGLKH